MATRCVVFMCTKKQKKDSCIKFYCLSMKNGKLLMVWLQRIHCKSISIHANTRSSAHTKLYILIFESLTHGMLGVVKGTFEPFPAMHLHLAY